MTHSLWTILLACFLAILPAGDALAGSIQSMLNLPSDVLGSQSEEEDGDDPDPAVSPDNSRRKLPIIRVATAEREKHHLPHDHTSPIIHIGLHHTWDGRSVPLRC